MITATPAMVHAQYRGKFAEPIFAVLGNPANLYANLLRNLSPFGATVSGLNINLSVLAQANVSCLLTDGYVKMSIDNVEFLLRNVVNQQHLEHVLTAVFSTMSETDASLVPVHHELTLATWSRLEQPFSSYIKGFVTAPAGLSHSKPTVEFSEPSGDGSFPPNSVRLEESAAIPEGLYLRSTQNLGTGPTEANELLSIFSQKFSAQLKALDLDMTINVK